MGCANFIHKKIHETVFNIDDLLHNSYIQQSNNANAITNKTIMTM